MAYSPSPTGNLLPNTCDIYAYVAAQDADGGNDPAACYPTATVTGAPCSAQNQGSKTIEQADGRVTEANEWAVYLGPAALAYALKTRAKVVLHVNGNTHTTFYDGSTDGAGRGSYRAIMTLEHV